MPGSTGDPSTRHAYYWKTTKGTCSLCGYQGYYGRHGSLTGIYTRAGTHGFERLGFVCADCLNDIQTDRFRYYLGSLELKPGRRFEKRENAQTATT